MQTVADMKLKQYNVKMMPYVGGFDIQNIATDLVMQIIRAQNPEYNTKNRDIGLKV